jgi:2,3-dihydroxyphenylpropionate 1,2-dioxygenase
VAEVVAAFSMSHAPGMLGWQDAPSADVRSRMSSAYKIIAERLNQAQPDVIVAFLDDHFENYYRNLMPTFSIGVAPSHMGPADYWLEALHLKHKQSIAGAPALAERILRDLISSGFDVARTGALEYGNNLMVPLHLIRPQADIPVIPIFINVFSPPLTTTARAFAFGEALRDCIDGVESKMKIAFLATGGLSHWPPFWNDRSPEEDSFLARMRRFQTDGRPVLVADPNLLTDLAAYEIEMAASNQWPLNSSHPLVNEEWDRKFLEALANGDVSYMRALAYDEVERDGGHGGHEILLWIALMGAMRGAPATIVDYEAVREWICGIGFAMYAT